MLIEVNKAAMTKQIMVEIGNWVTNEGIYTTFLKNGIPHNVGRSTTMEMQILHIPHLNGWIPCKENEHRDSNKGTA